MKSYYEILDIDFKATKDEIKAAYKKMAKLYHPDLNPKKDSSVFLEIKQAAETLLNDAKRKIYDKTFLKQNSTIEIEIAITKQESEKGTKRTINISKYALCPKCKGKGCKYCNNKGEDLKNSKINIIIPPKTENNNILRIKEFIVKIKIKDEEKLKIIDGTVYYEAKISPIEAILGAVINIETLWGQSHIRIPPLTKANRCFKLIGVGVLDETTGKKGDEIVSIAIEIPDSITKEETHLYQKIKNLTLKYENKN